MFNRSYINDHKNHPHYLSDLQFLSLRKSIKLTSKEKDFVEIIDNLTDPTKLKICFILARFPEISVIDLSQILKLSPSAASHALSDLKLMGLVKSEKCGHMVCYSLKRRKNLKKIINFFGKFIKAYE